MKKIMMAALCLTMLFACARAETCALCGGDGVCDTCGGNGYLVMQGYNSDEMVKVACTAGCDNGACPTCDICEVCGGLGYLTMQAYGSDEMVKVACTAEDCGAVANAQSVRKPKMEPKPDPGLPLEEEVAPPGTMLLVSPAEYTDGRVFIDESSSSWKYSTTGTFDMDAYIARLEEEYDISLKDVSEVGDCIFYDLSYRHLGDGNRYVLSLYTFSGGQKFELNVIKPKAGGIALPEFVGEEPVEDRAEDRVEDRVEDRAQEDSTPTYVIGEGETEFMVIVTEAANMDKKVNVFVNTDKTKLMDALTELDFIRVEKASWGYYVSSVMDIEATGSGYWGILEYSGDSFQDLSTPIQSTTLSGGDVYVFMLH